MCNLIHICQRDIDGIFFHIHGVRTYKDIYNSKQLGMFHVVCEEAANQQSWWMSSGFLECILEPNVRVKLTISVQIRENEM